MPRFGRKSLERLETVDPVLQEICHEVIKYYDITILPYGGFRGKEEQDRLVKEGKSKTPWPTSRHNINRYGKPHAPGIAVDVAAWPVQWDNTYEFVQTSGRMLQAAAQIGVELRWGGNWDGDRDIITDQRFNDLVHYELKL